MNWIEKMIAEQCPNGVVWKKIDEICKTKTPPFKLKTNEYKEQGAFPVIDQGQKRIVGYTDNKDALVEDGEYILYGDHTCIVKYYNGCFAQGADGLKILESPSNNSKYVYYAFCVYNLSSTEYKRHWTQAKKIEIPLPPLSIQKEIVSVLDKFSELIEKTDEEIALRQKQYEYYREKLLTFEKGEVEWKKLGEVALIGTGSRNTQDGMNVGQYPFYTRGQEILRLDEYDYNETAIITAGDGAGVGKTFHFVKGCYALHQRAYRFVANEHIISPKFLYNYIKQTFYDYIMRNSVFGSVPSVRKPMLEKYLIPIPSPSRQQSIVDTLDKFEALISKLKEERELRQKQYEYYREKLLTF